MDITKELSKEQKIDAIKTELKFAKDAELMFFKIFNKPKGKKTKIACEAWMKRKFITEVMKEVLKFVEEEESLEEILIDRLKKKLGP